MNRIAFVCGITMFLVIFNAAVAAEESGQASDQKCDGIVYEAKEVSRPARITFKPLPAYSSEARAHNVRGRVVLTAVLCRSGHVTDLQVIESLPSGLTEKAIEAARGIKFNPAEKDGSEVSQTTRLEYGFSIDGPGPPGRRPLAKEPIEGRMVESVAVVGLICRSGEEIWRHIKTRTTYSYRKERVNRDLEALLALGYFDSKQSSLRIEEGEKGGVGVVFILKELPQIAPCDK